VSDRVRGGRFSSAMECLGPNWSKTCCCSDRLKLVGGAPAHARLQLMELDRDVPEILGWKSTPRLWLWRASWQTRSWWG
jgi:hypothetical protein